MWNRLGRCEEGSEGKGCRCRGCLWVGFVYLSLLYCCVDCAPAASGAMMACVACCADVSGGGEMGGEKEIALSVGDNLYICILVLCLVGIVGAPLEGSGETYCGLLTRCRPEM